MGEGKHTIKACTGCLKIKPLDAFHADKQTPDKHKTRCRECRAKERRVMYLANREKRIQYTKDWGRRNPDKLHKQQGRYRRSLKRQIIEGYGGKCTCCGEHREAFLSLDHVDGGGREHRRKNNGSTGVYREVIDAGFPDKYTLLCMNCNFARRYERECPHETERRAHEAVKLND